MQDVVPARCRFQQIRESLVGFFMLREEFPD